MITKFSLVYIHAIIQNTHFHNLTLVVSYCQLNREISIILSVITKLLNNKWNSILQKIFKFYTRWMTVWPFKTLSRIL